MAVYLISDVGPVTPEAQRAWKAQTRRAPATMAQWGGRYLARGSAIDVIEGPWSPLAIARVAFPDDAVERGFPFLEYAEVMRIRGSLLHRDMIVVEGTSGG